MCAVDTGVRVHSKLRHSTFKKLLTELFQVGFLCAVDTGVRVDQNCVIGPLIKKLLTEMFQGVVFLMFFVRRWTLAYVWIKTAS